MKNDGLAVVSGAGTQAGILSGLLSGQPYIEALTSLVILVLMLVWLVKMVSDIKISRHRQRQRDRYYGHSDQNK